MSMQSRGSRRWIVRMALVALAMAMLPLWTSPASAAGKKVLFFTKSSGFQHSVIARKNNELGLAEKTLMEWGKKLGVEVVCSKDGTLFNPDQIGQFDAFVFYTTGDLTTAGTDKQPPMTPEAKIAFLKAIEDGKGFMGFHAASDTFHSKAAKRTELLQDAAQVDPATLDPYIAMLGGEFIVHGAQQKSTAKLVDAKFPGLDKFTDLSIVEEWYSLKNFAPNLHVILTQDTSEMKGAMYKRVLYPETWARMHGKGRVFYTSLGHREDVWTNPAFEQLVSAGLNWIVKNTEADVTPNLAETCPKAEPATAFYDELSKERANKQPKKPAAPKTK